MAEISYVVLSDLHFGATNSVLTDVRGMEACPNRATPLLEGLVEGLRVLTAGQAKKPTLVLAGDVLDLAAVGRRSGRRRLRGLCRPRFPKRQAGFRTRRATTCRVTTTTTSGSRPEKPST